MSKKIESKGLFERRFKIGYVSESILLEWFGQYRGAEFVSVPECGVPPGTLVHRVFFSLERAALGVIFFHPDWPVVPNGRYIPVIEGNWRTVLLRLAKHRKDKT